MAFSSAPKPFSKEGKNEKELSEMLYRHQKYVETSELARRITNSIKNCNLLFSDLTKVPTLFKEDIQAISALHQPCFNDNDFRIKIGSLAELFQVPQNEWKVILKKFDPKKKRGSSLLIQWLNEQEISYDCDKVKVWNAIIELRNSSFPYHQTQRKVIKLVKFFGQKFPINYVEFYESILRMLLDSLEMLQTILFTESERKKVE